MNANAIRVFLDAMDQMEPGVAVRKGTDGYWYAAHVPRIVPHPETPDWETFQNPLDAIRYSPPEEKT